MWLEEVRLIESVGWAARVQRTGFRAVFGGIWGSQAVGGGGGIRMLGA